ncbi:MAG: efflux RND transporter permease subunit, partial [Verrucomicrobiota bacterium]
PAGTPYEVTAAHIDRMEQAAVSLQEKYVDEEGIQLIEYLFSARGGSGIASTGGPRGRSASSGQSNVGELTFELMAPEERPESFRSVSGPQIAAELRTMIGAIPGAEELNYKAEIGRFGDPVDIRLRSTNEEDLKRAAEAVRDYLADFPDLYDIASNLDDGKEEIRFVMRPSGRLLGIDTNQLAQQTRGAFFGFEAQRLQRGRDDLRVMVRYPLEERQSLGNLQDLRLRSADGSRVPLTSIAEFEYTRSPSRIQRIDRSRTISITADANKDQTDVEGIKLAIRESIPELLAGYPTVEYSLEGEDRERREANSTLTSGLLFVFLAIYCMLAIPFRSYLQPFIVLSVIPFGFIGALVGHLIMGHSLSFMSYFGMLALSGVVVNDSLVMVDWVNRRRREGVTLLEAVRTGGGSPLPPHHPHLHHYLCWPDAPHL